MSTRSSNRCITRTSPLIQAVIIGVALVAGFASEPMARAGEPHPTSPERRVYHIPGGSLSQALSQFAGAAGVLLSADARLTDGKASPGLEGEFTVSDGLAGLLAGSGLAPVQDADGSYTLRRVAQTEATEPRAGEKVSSETEQETTELPEMTVTASPRDATSYNVLDASTATKTDTPIFDTPLSIQVIPQQVLKDQQACGCKMP